MAGSEFWPLCSTVWTGAAQPNDPEHKRACQARSGPGGVYFPSRRPPAEPFDISYAKGLTDPPPGSTVLTQCVQADTAHRQGGEWAMFLASVFFVLVSAILCVAAVGAMFAATDAYYLSSSDAIAYDGLARGSASPVWSLTAISGQLVHSPPQGLPFQLLVFASHSLKSFPSVVDGLALLSRTAPELEIVVLMRGSSEIAAPVLRMLGLGDLAIVVGSSALYGRYNVRVEPFVMFVDSEGLVRANSLVNHAWQLERLWQLARLGLAPEERPAPRLERLRRHMIRA